MALPLKYTYDEKGKLLDGDPFAEKIVSSKSQYEESILYYYRTGKKASSETYEYDLSGNVIAKTEYDSSGNMTNVEKRSYDESVELLSIIEIDRYSYVVKRINKYGYPDETTSLYRENKNDFSSFRDLRENYNQYGDVISEVFIRQDNDGELTESRIHINYEYDSKGNWIEQARYGGDSLIYKVKRIISYY